MISSSPAPPASTTPASLSTASSSGVRASDSSPRATMKASSSAPVELRAPRATRPPRPSRGSRSASSPRPGAGRRGRRRRSPSGTPARSCASSIGSRSPSTSAKPRTIWLKITPEFPRAPISAARESSRATASWPVGVRLLERLDDRPHGEREVRAGVAVGDRVDVEVVDPLLVRLEVAERERGRSHGRGRGSRRAPDVLDAHLDARRPRGPSGARPRTRRGCARSRRPRRG